MEKIVLELLNLLEESGYKSYIIGGYPRDRYLDLPLLDIDICTSAKENELKEIFKVVKIRKYGSYVINYKGYNFEVTTFRKDIGIKDNRNPIEIEYVNTLEEDLKRRDFIINTLAIDKDNNYVDLLGARGDMDNKIIRTVKNADISFKEDALRILRALRFSLKLGFMLDKDLEKSIYENSKLLDNISPFYLERELLKIISYKDGLEILKKYGLEKHLELLKK